MRLGWAIAACSAGALLLASLQLRETQAAPARVAPPQRVVVCTDIGAGIDDQWTLAHLALEPGLELAGVLTTHAPALAYPGSQTAARHAREVLAAVGRPEVPVVPGLVEPFGGEQDIKPGPAADLLLGASREHTRDKRLRVVVLGAATDVALALVVEPALADRIEVIAVGFDGWPGGRDGGNVKNDPLAWKLLLQSRVPLVVGDAIVAKRDLLVTRSQARGLAAGRGRTGAYLARLFDGWLDQAPASRRAVAGQPDAWPLRDHLTVAWLLGHAHAATRPRPQLGLDLSLLHGGKAATPPIRWIDKVDAAPVWQAFQAALDRRAAAER